jgi:hypothetical protein
MTFRANYSKVGATRTSSPRARTRS